jgi:ABC-type dipeptide/oligopeptide/nickel transport system ATPase component
MSDSIAPATEALLSVSNLRISFRHGGETTEAVRGVSFAMQPGEVRAVVGESGSGKTVTARALARLLPAPPRTHISGSIHFDGADVNALSARELRSLRGRGIGYVFQEPSAAVHPSIRIGSQVLEVLKHHAGDANRGVVLDLLARVGLRDPEQVFHAYPAELSGGMLQRVVIAMALAPRPRLLVADEPTTALDVTVERQIIDLLAELRQSLDLAILLITHNFGIVQGFAEQTQVMKEGEIVENGPTERILSTPQHRYTKSLLKCRPQLGKPQSRLYTGFTIRQ